MSLKLVAIVSALLLALCLSQVLGAATTVRPYKFGFTIDEQQHRQEKRDERGIVMGEFGFITADGIYHVTVYATDEEGKFRIISMKSYPYNGPIGSKSVPAATTPRAALPAPPAPPRQTFHTEGCAGCFLKKSPPKTEIRTLSQPLAPAPAGKPADLGLNVQLPFRDSIAQTVATQLGLGQVTQHTTHTYTNPSAQAPVKDIEAGLQLAMATYFDSKAAVTGHVSTQTQNARSPSSTKVAYNVGVTRKAGPVTYAPLNTRLSEDAIRSASTYSGRITAPLALANQPLVAPAATKIFALDGHNNVPLSSNLQSVAQRPSVNIGHALRGGVASAKKVSGSRPQHTTTLAHNPHSTLSTLGTPFLNAATSTGTSAAPTGRAPSYNNGGGVAGATGGSFPLGKSPAGGAAGQPQLGSAGKGGVSGVQGGFGGSGTSGVSGGSGGSAGLGGSGGLGVSGSSGISGSSGGKSGASGSAFGASGGLGGGSAGRGGGSGTIARGETGDLYKFKYLLDYNGHEETGSRNGDKQGSYFAIGEDAVERTIEYIANEFGFQPHISWKKLDGKASLPEENSLKHYEFQWFN